jgi:hypothetical protein
MKLCRNSFKNDRHVIFRYLPKKVSFAIYRVREIRTRTSEIGLIREMVEAHISKKFVMMSSGKNGNSDHSNIDGGVKNYPRLTRKLSNRFHSRFPAISHNDRWQPHYVHFSKVIADAKTLGSE